MAYLVVIQKGPIWFSYKRGIFHCYTKGTYLVVIPKELIWLLYQRDLFGCDAKNVLITDHTTSNAHNLISMANGVIK